MQDLAAILLVGSVVVALFALYRRWECRLLRFDRGFNLALLFTVGAGVFMVWGMLDPELNSVDLAGCALLISAAAAGANTTAAMILPDHYIPAYTRKMIIAPSACSFLIQLGCVVLPEVEWIFWLTLLVIMGYLTSIELHALRVLRREQRHRRVADFYTLSAVTAMGAAVSCAIRDVLDLPTAQMMVILFSVSIASFTIGAWISWENRKQKWFTPSRMRQSDGAV